MIKVGEKNMLNKKLVLIIAIASIVSLTFPSGSCLDIAASAIKAKESSVYSPNTAWDLGYTGNGIVIAVIDSGVDDEEHESLKGKFVAGVDFTKPINPITNPDDGSVNPDDNNGHGTFVASCAIGTGGSEGKYKGIAPNAKLIDVKHGAGGLTYERFKKCLDWCIDHKDTQWENQPSIYWGVDIISISLEGGSGSDGQNDIAQLINKAVDNGIVVVILAGNEGPNNNGFGDGPSADKAITVGAIDDMGTVDRTYDVIADFSNRGPRADDGDDDHYDELKPDVVAPGVNIMGAKWDTENEYIEWDGTSWSTPMVAGVAALMLQANPDLKPTPDRNPIQEILRKTAESRGNCDSDLGYEGSDSYYNYSYGWGIVDAYKAVRAAEEWEVPHQNIPPSISIINPKNNAEVSDTIMISGSASDSDGNVTNVELRFDDNNWFNVSIGSASSLEWNYTWDTKNVENGMHTIHARAYDGENYSATISVDVNVYNEAILVDDNGENKKFIPGFDTLSFLLVIGIVFLFKRKRWRKP